VIDASDATHIEVNAESESSDELDGIDGGSAGQIVILRPSGDTITVRHDQSVTSPILLDGQTNKTLDNNPDTLTLIYEEGAGFWYQIATSQNG